MTPEQINQLERLSNLKQQGALTDDEFEAQKARILAGSANSQTVSASQKNNSIFGFIAVIIAVIIFFTPKFLVTIPLILLVIFSIIGLVRDGSKIWSGIALVVAAFIVYSFYQEMANATAEYEVKYEVECDDCEVRYTNETGGSDKANARFIWQKQVTLKGEEFAHLSAQCNRNSTKATARIYVNGKLLDEKTSTGEFVIASASGRPDEILSK